MQDDHRECSAEAPTSMLSSKLPRRRLPRRSDQKKNSDQAKSMAHDENFIHARIRDQLFVDFPESRQKTFAVSNEPEEDCLKDYETSEDVNEDCTGVADLDFREFMGDSDSDSSSCSSSDSSDEASSDCSDDNERSTEMHSEEYSEDCGGEKSSGPAHALAASLDRIEQVFLPNEDTNSPSPPHDDDQNSINHNSNNPFAAGFDFAMNRPTSPKVHRRRSNPFCAIKFDSPKQEMSINRRRKSSTGSLYADGYRHSLPDIFAPLEGEEIRPAEDPVKAVTGLKPYSRGMEDQVFAAFQRIAQNMARQALKF